MIIKGRPFRATSLRLILSISLFLVPIGGGVAFHYAKVWLNEYAVATSHTVADASASQNTLQNLQAIEKQLQEKEDTVMRASEIVAESKSYQYQDQIITDLNSYATQAGISITNISFATANTAQPTQGAATTPPQQAGLPTGVKSSQAVITLKNPVDYTNLLKFIRSIEQNLTKMQISRINLSKEASGPGISSDALTIEVYVR